MPTLTVKNAPENVVKRLRERARQNHRSLQGELLFIVEKAAYEGGGLNNQEFFARVEAIGLKSNADSVEMLREDRSSH